MSFPPFILSLTVVSLRADTAVQTVVEPCNIAVYLHPQNPYLHSISRTSRNKFVYPALISGRVVMKHCNQ